MPKFQILTHKSTKMLLFQEGKCPIFGISRKPQIIVKKCLLIFFCVPFWWTWQSLQLQKKLFCSCGWHANSDSYLVDTSESHFVENGYEQITHDEQRESGSQKPSPRKQPTMVCNFSGNPWKNCDNLIEKSREKSKASGSRTLQMSKNLNNSEKFSKQEKF